MNSATAREAYAQGLIDAHDLFVEVNKNNLPTSEFMLHLYQHIDQLRKPLICNMAEPSYSAGRGQCMDVTTAAYKSHD